MDKLVLAMSVMVCFTLLFTGYALRELQGVYLADRDLTSKIQTCMAERDGFKQLYNTANAGVKTEQMLTVKSSPNNDENLK